MKSTTRTTAYPIRFLLASSLLFLSCNGFSYSPSPPLILKARPSTFTFKATSTRLFVNSDPYQELMSRSDNNNQRNDEYDLEYAYRGDDYGYDHHYEFDDREPLQENRALIDLVNNIMRMMHRSFQNVEAMANGLLKEQPVVALAIFVGAILVAAYLLGFLLLDGGIETWNPVNNGMVPYWDEEIHVVTRRIH